MAVMTRADFAKAQWPGIKSWFGHNYAEKDLECTKIFKVKSSDKAYEEEVQVTTFGLVPTKSEGGPFAMDAVKQGFTKRYTSVTYAMGFMVTREEDEDNKYPALQTARTQALASSFRKTREQVGANVLNRAFNSSYLGGDAKELCATDHPLQHGGLFSNELATPASLSEASVEDLMIQISQAVDERGLLIGLKPRKLVVPPALHFKAQRILGSTNQSGTANNDINVLRALSLLPEGAMVFHWLSSGTAYFILTDAPSGLTHYKRREMDFQSTVDKDTENRIYRGSERYAFGWTDPRGVYGSAGA